MRRLGLLSAVLLALSWVGVMAAENAPRHEDVTVDLATPVHVGAKVLPAGHYTIIAENVANGATGFLIQGKKADVRTAASKIPSVQKPAPATTKLMMRKIGDNFYLDKIWIRGKTFGWQIPLPQSVSSQQGQEMEVFGVDHSAQEQQQVSHGAYSGNGWDASPLGG